MLPVCNRITVWGLQAVCCRSPDDDTVAHTQDRLVRLESWQLGSWVFEAAGLGIASDPYRSVALHLDVGGAEVVHEGLDASSLRYSHFVRIVFHHHIRQGSLCIARNVGHEQC